MSSQINRRRCNLGYGTLRERLGMTLPFNIKNHANTEMTQYSTNFQYTLLLFLNPFDPFPNLAYIVCVIIQNKDEHRLESKNRSSLYNSLSYFTPNKESLSRECLDVVRSTFGRLMSTQSHRRTILYSKYVTAPSNQCFVCVSECV